MKVLHVLEEFLLVSENWIYPQITGVPGIEPGVLCAKIKNEELFPLNGAPLFQDPPPWNRAFGIPRLVNSLAFRMGVRGFTARRAVMRWQPEIIHAHFGPRGWDMLALKRTLGVPLVTSFYGIDAWKFAESSASWRKRMTELFSSGDLCLAEGPAMAERLCAIGCPAEKVRVMRLGVDVSRIELVERDFSGPLEVVMMARFVEKKGLPDGLRACCEAIRRGADLRVTIVGDSTDEAGDAIKRELNSAAASIPQRVEFTGFLKPADAHAVLRRAHIFLCPSKHGADGDAEGGSPVSLTEAMASGLVCVGTRHCDLPEVILDGGTGWLRESGDVAGLADTLVDVCSRRGDLAPLCRRGRAHIEARFSISGMVTALGDLYRSISHG
jgi:colanic acid/amylovoran biosynthesis glycosyltransferase